MTAQDIRVWTRERLASCSNEVLPRKLAKGGGRAGVFRMRKSESLDAWRQRMMLLVDQGSIDLTPRPKKAKSSGADRYLDRLEATIKELENAPFNLTQEQDRRRFGTMDFETPALDRLESRSYRERSIPSDDRGGMWSVRLSMHQWIGDTLTLKLEEAVHCELSCLTCPAGQALACATMNMSSALKDGFDLRDLFLVDNSKE